MCTATRSCTAADAECCIRDRFSPHNQSQLQRHIQSTTLGDAVHVLLDWTCVGIDADVQQGFGRRLSKIPWPGIGVMYCRLHISQDSLVSGESCNLQ